MVFEKINKKGNLMLPEKYKDELTSFVVNKDSNYPIIKGCKSGSTRLEDIYNYLISSTEENKESKKRIWPNFIKEAEKHNNDIDIEEVKQIDKKKKLEKKKRKK